MKRLTGLAAAAALAAVLAGCANNPANPAHNGNSGGYTLQPEGGTNATNVGLRAGAGVGTTDTGPYNPSPTGISTGRAADADPLTGGSRSIGN